jgi:hypothetical protein
MNVISSLQAANTKHFVQLILDGMPSSIRYVESILRVCPADRDERATYKNIPIDVLPFVQAYFKQQGKKIRVRYRGPRNNPLDTRYSNQRMQDCVKQFANRFTVYFE